MIKPSKVLILPLLVALTQIARGAYAEPVNLKGMNQIEMPPGEFKGSNPPRVPPGGLQPFTMGTPVGGKSEIELIRERMDLLDKKLELLNKRLNQLERGRK